MALLIVIPAGYLGRALSIFLSGNATSRGFGVDPGGRVGIFLSLAIFFIPLVVLFLLFPSLFGGLHAVKALKSWSFLFLGLELMTIKVFLLPCKLISLGKLVALKIVTIYFFH